MTKSERRKLKELRKSLRKSAARRAESRRRRRARNNPGMPTWQKVALGIGIAVLIVRGPAIWRGVVGIFQKGVRLPGTPPAKPKNIPPSPSAIPPA